MYTGLYTGPSAGAPYRPGDDAQVLERLPARPTSPAEAEVRRLRASLAAAPGDRDTAIELAQRFFERASAEGDARYVGYAEGVLRPLEAQPPTAQLLFTRGLLRQYRHDFAGALGDLEEALRLDPDLAAAHSWRAAIFMVQARYPAAAQECAALEGRASELVTTGCSAHVAATTGEARVAYERLHRSLRAHPGARRELRLWVLTRLAEIAVLLNEPAMAERHFLSALALGLTDNFLLAAYADFLLQRGRPKAVVALLKDATRSDALLLRLALAARALGLPEAGSYERALADRFAAAALRGERLHLGEEARFLLDVKRDPPAAVAAAAENWKTQREPRDAAILLEAALAAKDRRAAEPALRWLADTRYESTPLRQVAAKLR